MFCTDQQIKGNKKIPPKGHLERLERKIHFAMGAGSLFQDGPHQRGSAWERAGFVILPVMLPREARAFQDRQ